MEREVHSFDIDIAAKVGVNAAVIYRSIRFWISKNRENERHFYDGRYWTYSSVKAFGKLFPYLTEKQVRSAIDKLKDSNLIEVGNYNKSAYDRTVWYATTEVCNSPNASAQIGESICPKSQIEMPDLSNESAQNGEPIPDILQDNITDNITDNTPLTPLEGRRALETNPRSLGTNPRAIATNPRATGENPRAMESESAKTWKDDFQVYLSGLQDAYRAIRQDNEWITKQERLNPNVDVLLSVEKSCVNFWSTEAGWRNKKKGGAKSIDWKSTFANAIPNQMNRVYKQRTNEAEQEIYN